VRKQENKMMVVYCLCVS